MADQELVRGWRATPNHSTAQHKEAPDEFLSGKDAEIPRLRT